MALPAIRKFTDLVAFKHTLFGLPITLLACFLALTQLQLPGNVLAYRLFFIIVAFTGARTAGMALNRLFDEAIDAKNPRTSSRAMPSGRISAYEVKVVAVLSLSVFVIACAMLSLKILVLTPLIIFLLVFYSLSKRGTPYCHCILGAIEFFAPLLGWWAIAERLHPAAFCLGFSIFFWIAGMDILYATQDLHFDKAFGVYSFPSVYGEKNARALAKRLHILAFAGFVAAGVMVQISWPYYAAMGAVFIAFAKQHRTRDIGALFFTSNAVISVFLFLGSMSGWLWNLLS